MINVVEEVAEGRAHVSWSTVTTTHNQNQLKIYVFRDAMKFDNVPALEWDFDPVAKNDPWYTDEIFDGVRLPAKASELQQIADLTGCMLLTPLIVDQIWKQAELRFNAVVNTPLFPDPRNKRRLIVAESDIHVVHKCIEAEIEKRGGDGGTKLISCVGKYWVLINNLLTGFTPRGESLLYGDKTACNYGWFAQGAPLRSVTGEQFYQTPGFKHDVGHWDPSQTIRLMFRKAVLTDRHGDTSIVDLHDVATDPALAPLIHHQPGTLKYLRIKSVPEPSQSMALKMYEPTVS